MKSGKVLLYVGIYVVAAYGGYAIYKNTKSYMAGYLVKNKLTSGTKEQVFHAFEKDFIKAWYNGAKNNSPSFLYKSEKYNTKGGTKII